MHLKLNNNVKACICTCNIPHHMIQELCCTLVINCPMSFYRYPAGPALNWQDNFRRDPHQRSCESLGANTSSRVLSVFLSICVFIWTPCKSACVLLNVLSGLAQVCVSFWCSITSPILYPFVIFRKVFKLFLGFLLGPMPSSWRFFGILRDPTGLALMRRVSGSL